MFTNQRNIVTESGVHAYLYSNYYHKAVFAKLNLKTEHPPISECLIWNYKNANINIISHAHKLFD